MKKINLEIIRSNKAAMVEAIDLLKQMEVGEVAVLNSIRVEKVEDGMALVSGAEYCHDGSGHDRQIRMHDVELGDLIFWPERKRVNDAIRSGSIKVSNPGEPERVLPSLSEGDFFVWFYVSPDGKEISGSRRNVHEVSAIKQDHIRTMGAYSENPRFTVLFRGRTAAEDTYGYLVVQKVDLEGLEMGPSFKASEVVDGQLVGEVYEEPHIALSETPSPSAMRDIPRKDRVEIYRKLREAEELVREARNLMVEAGLSTLYTEPVRAAYNQIGEVSCAAQTPNSGSLNRKVDEWKTAHADLEKKLDQALEVKQENPHSLPTIPCPISDHYDFSGVSSYDPCAVCGRDVKNQKHMIVFDFSTNEVHDPRVCQQDALDGDLGLAPVGSDCLKKNPILRPYLVKEDQAPDPLEDAGEAYLGRLKDASIIWDQIRAVNPSAQLFIWRTAPTNSTELLDSGGKDSKGYDSLKLALDQAWWYYRNDPSPDTVRIQIRVGDGRLIWTVSKETI